jgi:oxygen-independent coproporphyrinogen-3 oxidase
MNTLTTPNTNLSYLIQKYDVPCPRYTSYPTVPYWENNLNEEEWKELVKSNFEKTNSKEGISLYIHLPYCEALCTYCACNKRITTNHSVEEPYINAVLKEWNIYRALWKNVPIIKEIHLGGGTPTFFSPENLKRLIQGLLGDSVIAPNHSFSIEVHPNYTTEDHLKTLAELGFKRLSVGIQDFDLKVQFVINRIQSFEKTKWVVDVARKFGFDSINADIIFGLPLQTSDSITKTIGYVKELKPDRIAFYSYAHVPWKSKSQRRYTEADLPSPNVKRGLYELGKSMLLEAGYHELGMDHFALKTDSLFQAFQNKTLHRNFMGYTTEPTQLLVGLGVSSISDSWTGFMQNVKEVEEYLPLVDKGKLPLSKGHQLTEEDLLLRKFILDLMCRMEVSLTKELLSNFTIKKGLEKLKEIESDGLVNISSNKIQITSLGKGFIRNVCACFDARLLNTTPDTPIFSKSI